ncbi:MAG: hypothetical protein DWH91_18765 [Planctomycetota bacterium]|nr:MAG: hypothetical protein DWH91_18765 [Planctomycetota bacterium]
MSQTTELRTASDVAPILPRSRFRRWYFRGLLLLVVWGGVELMAWGLLTLVLAGGLTSVWIMQDGTLKKSPQGDGVAAHSTQAVHPFLGWVRNPDILPGEISEGVPLQTSRYGFMDTTDGIHQRRPDRLIVGITGGSVAHYMSVAGADALRDRLRSVPDFRDREIIIVRLAQLAYKQPQALFSLNYFLLHGGEFDIVINLDGYNEIALAMMEGYHWKMALDYPQGWSIRAAEIVDPRDSEVALRIIELRGARQRATQSARQSPFRWLPTHALLWYVQERRSQAAMIDAQQELSQARAGQRSFLRFGPPATVQNADEALEECVRLWKQSSLQMHQICEANHILYVHAIQPNQHDPGSKPLTAEESHFIDLESPLNAHRNYGPVIAQGFPMLRAAGQELRLAGVRNLDLTSIFSSHAESLYIDSCCHVNPTGSQILATAIADYVIEQLPMETPEAAPSGAGDRR